MDEVTYLTVAYLYMTVKHECDLVSLVWFPDLSTPGMKKEWCQKYGWAGELVSQARLSLRRRESGQIPSGFCMHTQQ